MSQEQGKGGRKHWLEADRVERLPRRVFDDEIECIRQYRRAWADDDAARQAEALSADRHNPGDPKSTEPGNTDAKVVRTGQASLEFPAEDDRPEAAAGAAGAAAENAAAGEPAGGRSATGATPNGGPGPESDEIRRSLTGLALSGGGIRSAAFNLGFIQALCAKDKWRQIDYLSTVSGGGYIGSAISALGVEADKPADVVNQLAPTKYQPQPPFVRRMIYGGEYLIRGLWGKLSNQILAGWVLMSLFTFSGIMALAAGLAWLVRLTDEYRFELRAFGISGDLLRAIFPVAAVFGLWLLAVLIGYLIRGLLALVRTLYQAWVEWRFTDYHRNDLDARFAAYSQSFLFYWQYFKVGLLSLALVAAALSLVTLLGIGDISEVSIYETPLLSWDAAWLAGVQSFLGTTMLIPLITFLVPLLRPSRLLEGGLNAQGTLFDRIKFGGAAAALLVGIPLFVFGWMVKENVSGHNGRMKHDLTLGEVRYWFHSEADAPFWAAVRDEYERGPSNEAGANTKPPPAPVRPGWHFWVAVATDEAGSFPSRPISPTSLYGKHRDLLHPTGGEWFDVSYQKRLQKAREGIVRAAREKLEKEELFESFAYWTPMVVRRDSPESAAAQAEIRRGRLLIDLYWRSEQKLDSQSTATSLPPNIKQHHREQLAAVNRQLLSLHYGDGVIGRP